MRNTVIMSLLLCAGLQGMPAHADEVLAQQILKELIDSNTAPSGGNDMSGAIAAISKRLLAAGFTDDELTVVAPNGGAANLVVRYRSASPQQKPILLMAHLDVVEALREDWSVDPFTMIEKDGYFYGRGTVDNKAGAAIIVANFIRMKQEGYQPDRDLIAMLTGDEESTGAGANWITTERRELIDAEFALNTDAGFVNLDGEKRTAFIVQTSEKVYVSFRLQALDPGGHSSLPRQDNPIYRMSRALAAQQQNIFPVDTNDTTQAFFAARAAESAGEQQQLLDALANGDFDDSIMSALPTYSYFNAQARTTCVATGIEGGHAENALPQTATAIINCRVLPQMDVEHVKQTLTNIVAPFDVTLEQIDVARPSPPSPLTDAVMKPVASVASEMWPGIKVEPEMSTGATDGLFVRSVGIPVYGVSAIAEEPDEQRAHGQDERISVASFNDALQYWYRLLRVMSGG
jgi:acetylornithine deacetylase/succinyl-diaminopimelate desuccinylase-like protein